MPLRITDTAMNAQFMRQVNASRQRLNQAQDQIGSGKRINRPSDDPVSTATAATAKASTPSSRKEAMDNAPERFDRPAPEASTSRL